MAGTDKASQNAKNGTEEAPSMEEILQSIRGVIAGDKEENDDVLELTDMAEEEKTAAPQNEPSVLDNIDAALEMEQAMEAPAEETKEEPLITQEEPLKEQKKEKPAKSIPGGEHLITDPTKEKSSDEMRNLLNNMPKIKIDSPSFRSGVTVEDLVIEAMKPFLADWLNENLPTLVKHLVEKEIKRIVPHDED